MPKARKQTSIRKSARITTRYTEEQLARLARAAEIVSAERRETVDESALSRELTNAGVNRILDAQAAA